MATKTDENSLIALLTDFGATDPYVGSLKAAIYGVHREATVVDLCHYIRPQNILHGAFVLRMVYRDYPEGTIFVCVVDPGVGSDRKAIAVQAGPYSFVGPDNGLFSYIYEQESADKIIVLSNEKLWRHPVSSTFHGRDIFAPCAAWLSKDKKLSELGDPLDRDPCKLKLPTVALDEEGSLQGQALHIDRFGNLITNIHQDDFEKAQKKIGKKRVELNVSDWIIPFGKSYQSVSKDALLGIWGSSGFLEVSAREGSAQDILDCDLREVVRIEFRDS